jgi:hypothetical protein
MVWLVLGLNSGFMSLYAMPEARVSPARDLFFNLGQQEWHVLHKVARFGGDEIASVPVLSPGLLEALATLVASPTNDFDYWKFYEGVQKRLFRSAVDDLLAYTDESTAERLVGQRKEAWSLWAKELGLNYWLHSLAKSDKRLLPSIPTTFGVRKLFETQLYTKMMLKIPTKDYEKVGLVGLKVLPRDPVEREKIGLESLPIESIFEDYAGLLAKGSQYKILEKAKTVVYKMSLAWRIEREAAILEHQVSEIFIYLKNNYFHRVKLQRQMRAIHLLLHTVDERLKIIRLLQQQPLWIELFEGIAQGQNQPLHDYQEAIPYLERLVKLYQAQKRLEFESEDLLEIRADENFFSLQSVSSQKLLRCSGLLSEPMGLFFSELQHISPRAAWIFYTMLSGNAVQDHERSEQDEVLSPLDGVELDEVLYNPFLLAPWKWWFHSHCPLSQQQQASMGSAFRIFSGCGKFVFSIPLI